MKQDDIVARAIPRDPPDIKALARAYIQLAIQQEQKRLAKKASRQRATSPEPSDLVK